LSCFKEARAEFRRLCKRKTLTHKESIRDDVVQCSDQPILFWKKIKQLGKKCLRTPNISANEWFLYFKRLLNQEVKMDQNFEQHVQRHLVEYEQDANDVVNEEMNWLNREITRDEIDQSIKSFARGKASGEDGVIIEMIKSSQHIVMPYLCSLFNKVLFSGVYPTQWSKAILCPIYKKGLMSNPENFRGISLLPIVGKVFAKIINMRLVNWAEVNNMQHEEQAGYKRGYCTVDQIFNLQSLVQKYLCRAKGRYYVLFVDFTKAFDTIPHFLLWYKLMNSGIKGNIIDILKTCTPN